LTVSLLIVFSLFISLVISDFPLLSAVQRKELFTITGKSRIASRRLRR
jgi:hypothetical protein